MARVSKWGNSLALRLPSSMVEALALQTGDEVDLRVVGRRAVEVAPKLTREQALEGIRSRRQPLPASYAFDREEANAR